MPGSITDSIKEGFKSFAGDIPRAVLVVRNPASIPAKKEEGSYYMKLDADDGKEAVPGDNERTNTLNAVKAMLPLKLLLQQELYGKNKGAPVRFEGVTEKVNNFSIVIDQDENNKNPPITFVAIGVQYNPSSISLDTVAGTSYSDNTGKFEKMEAPVATTLNVQLIFDAMNVQDAFMLSNLAPSIGNAGSMIRNKGEDFNVQTILDGMLSLLQTPFTRYVLFIWSGMFFFGEVVSVSVKYTMFNKEGNPIRGTANLSIRQSQAPAEKSGNNRQTYWEKAFYAYFDKEDASGGSKKKYVNNNILNLNM